MKFALFIQNGLLLSRFKNNTYDVLRYITLSYDRMKEKRPDQNSNIHKDRKDHLNISEIEQLHKSKKIPSPEELFKGFMKINKNLSKARNFAKESFDKIDFDDQSINYHKINTHTTRAKKYLPLPSPSLISELEFKPLSNVELKKNKTYQLENPIFDRVDELESNIRRESLCFNRYHEMMEWTLQGKIWNFPIDNEFDLGKESDIPFYEHVFLHKNLDRKVLKVAPLILFMEMVCAGLSKNPNFTLSEKKEYLAWYQQYFSDKIPQIEAALVSHN